MIPGVDLLLYRIQSMINIDLLLYNIQSIPYVDLFVCTCFVYNIHSGRLFTSVTYVNVK